MAVKVIETKEHAKVLVISKGAPELMPFGDNINKTTIKGSEGGADGVVEYDYHTFSGRVADALVVGSVADCDYDVTESADGQFINRKIKQVYTDGQGVVGGGGQKGGRSYGKSPEEIASIERQVAFKGAIELASSGKIEVGGIISQSANFMAFLKSKVTPPLATATPTLTEHAKVLVEDGVLESAVVDQAALKGLAAIAKDAKEWPATVAEKNQWLKDTAKEMFGKDIKEITEDELGRLTAMLAEHIENQQTEGNPF